MERTPGYEPGDVRSSRAGKAFEYRRMAKLVSHPALNRKNAGSIPAASAYGACGLMVKTPDCGSGDGGSIPSMRLKVCVRNSGEKIDSYYGVLTVTDKK